MLAPPRKEVKPRLAPLQRAPYTADMALEHHREGAALVFRPEGDVGEDLLKEVSGILAEAPTGRVVLDLSATPYLSSQGISLLLALQARLAASSCVLALAAPSPLVRRILHQAGIAGVVPLHANVAEARAEPPATPS